MLWLRLACFVIAFALSGTNGLTESGVTSQVCVEETTRKDVDDNVTPSKVQKTDDSRQCIVECLKSRNGTEFPCKAVVFRSADNTCKLYAKSAKSMLLLVDADYRVTYFEIMTKCPNSDDAKKHSNADASHRDLGLLENLAVNDANSAQGSNRTRSAVLKEQGEAAIAPAVLSGYGVGPQTTPPSPPGQWTPWSAWSSCPCPPPYGVGNVNSQTRTRTCLPIPPCPGNAVESQPCPPCSQAQWTPWSQWTTCPVTCGGGTISRTRQCSVQNGCTGAYNEQTPCANAPCRNASQWQQWGPWSPCTVTCGSGMRERIRQCENTGYGAGGENGCVGPSTEKEPCNTNQPCCTEWTPWNTCSVTCSSGTQTRSRNCGDEGVIYPGSSGGSSKTEEQPCNAGPCPSWGPWAPFGPCSTTCGPGQRVRTRQCENGDGCIGENTDSNPCDAGPCPHWSEWGPWAPCSVTCGPGYQTAKRQCVYGILCPGDANKSQPCNGGMCFDWCPWERWSPCSVTCGSGERNRKRVCSIPGSCGNEHHPVGGQVPSGYGNVVPEDTRVTVGQCDGDGQNVETCNQGPCATWSDWGPWSPCSATCGPGVQMRTRTCAGGSCTGEAKQTQSCINCPCPSWTEWSPWTPCSAYCGQGTRGRTRECSNACNGQSGSSSGGYPSHGPVACPGEPTQSDACTKQCAQWTPWENWSPCSVTCGSGEQTRSRTCTGGTDCPGDGNERHDCLSNPCIIPTAPPVYPTAPPPPPPYQGR